MDNFRNNNEESQFFDAQEQITREPDFVCDYSPFNANNEYDVWINAPQSVKERRRKFIRWMGLSLGGFERENSIDLCDSNTKNDLFEISDSHRIMENSGAVLRSSIIEDEFSSSRSSLDSSEFRNGDLKFNGESECVVDRIVEKGHFGNFPQSSPSVKQFVSGGNGVNVDSPRRMKNLKNRWLSKLSSLNCMMMSGNVNDGNVGPSGFTRARRIRVRHSRRRSKEISALFTGQDIKAHEGAITAMKFSLDGKYLASAGEDKIIKIWQVGEDERLDTNIDLDPSCVYFSANHLSELEPLMVGKDKTNNSKRRTRDSACVIFPPKVFRILEKPLHVFEGHFGEILDLSWSKSNSLLSSSVDKTVRLWRVGVDDCIQIFPHSDYVTSIQFNPVNDNYFISGSIDGKVRIWAISDRKVVDWTETTDVITAVSYHPDSQSGIIGSITGTCRFFDLSDNNHLQLGPPVSLTSKKKSRCKRITAFQFLSQDPSKVLVTCADSKVRIIDGMNVIGKYKGGLRNAGNQISASFTSDGKHIVSASDDSNIYIWNHTNQSQPLLSKPKPIRSFECFSSEASIAIPWPGRNNGPSTNSPPFSPSDYFSLSQEFFLDSVSKGSATWPEEKLPATSPPNSKKSTLSKSQYKFFKNSCQISSESHAWGLVIVTGGLDGRIRSFHNYGLPVSL